MLLQKLKTSYHNITLSLSFLETVINNRFQLFFNKEDSVTEDLSYPGLTIQQDDSELALLLSRYSLTIEEYVILLLALQPHTHPHLLDTIIQSYLPNGGDFPEIGGTRAGNHRAMLPTGETAQFILAGNDLGKRLHIQALLLGESILVKEKIITLEPVRDGDPVMSGRLLLSREWLSKTLTGTELHPDYNQDFPAKLITTQMNWDDLVLNQHTHQQIDFIKTWLEHNASVLQDEVLKRKIKPGFRVMFHGPSGTGKTLTATLLGRQFNKDVYRIDLSQVVSKYIGETEKNLEKIFAKAECMNWILFFDEADALFGKRTTVQSAHDRYANQEVSYLLQRVENYAGLIILASNFKNNIDDAFLRRLNTIVHFPPPSKAERQIIWQKTMPASLKVEPAIQWQTIIERYDLTGAAILNIVHYAALKSFSRSDEYIRMNDLLEGIKKEYRKEEKSI